MDLDAHQLEYFMKADSYLERTSFDVNMLIEIYFVDILGETYKYEPALFSFMIFLSLPYSCILLLEELISYMLYILCCETLLFTRPLLPLRVSLLLGFILCVGY